MDFEAENIDDNQHLKVKRHNLGPLLLRKRHCMQIVVINSALDSLTEECHAA